MKQKIMSIFLVIIMVLSILPMTVFAASMTIYAETPTKEIVTLDIQAADSIENLKTKIQSKTGFSPNEMKLYYNDQLLNNGRTLADYNIQSGDTLRIALVKSYLALGDSISTGYGLQNVATESFPALIKEMLGDDYLLVNKAVNGATTTSLAKNLSEDSTLRNAVTEADLITLTIGGNDLMALLYNYLATNMDITPKLNPDEVAAALTSGNMTVLNAAAKLINNGGFQPTADDFNSIKASLSNAIGLIRGLNANAPLIITTQYNPYAELAAQIKSIQTFLPFVAPDYVDAAAAIIQLSNDITTALANYNKMVKDGFPNISYYVADVSDAFSQSTETLCNAGMSTNPIAINLDIHPNAKGHKLIADTMATHLPTKHQHSGTDDGDCTTPVYCSCGEVYIAAKSHVSTNDNVATYTKKAICDVCNTTYGDVLPDDIKPSVNINITTNNWTTFINTVTFGLFFNNTQTVNITAEDNQSGVAKAEYCLSETNYQSEQAVLDDTNITWTELSLDNSGCAHFNINPNNSYIIYLKVTDKANNVTVVRSDGIVLDNIAPLISGIENNGTYCGSVEITVNENNLESVKVNGTEITLTNNKFTVSYTGKETYEIVAKDKAGNTVSKTIKINKDHTLIYNTGNANIIETCQYCDHKAEASLIVASKEYDKQPIDAKITYTGTLIGGNNLTIAYDILDNSYKPINYVPTNAGQYRAIITLGGETVQVLFRINPKPVEIPKSDTTDFVYTGVALTYHLPTNEAYTIIGNEETSAGQYYVELELVNNNYIWDDGTTTNKLYSFFIDKITVSAPEIDSKIFTGETLTADIQDTVLYTVETNNGGIKSGTYDVVLRLTDPHNYKWQSTDNATLILTFEITKATLTVTANDNTITYGDKPIGNGVTYSGFVNGENESVIDGTLAYDSNYIQYDNVGNNYTITPKGLTSDNYDILYMPGNLSVIPLEANIEWSSLTEDDLVYDGNAKILTATVKNALNGDDVSVQITLEGDNVNVTTDGFYYKIDEITGSKRDNYKIGNANSPIYKITKTAPTITILPIASRIVVGDTLSDSILTSGQANTVTNELLDGTFDWKDSSLVMNNVGKNKATVIFTPEISNNTNYKSIEFDIEIEVVVCNTISGEHDFSELNKSNLEHWYNCTECGLEMPNSRQKHTGDHSTCTTKAKCSVCDTEYGILLQHSYKWVVDKAPTTSEEGSKHEECSVCNTKRNENTTIPKLKNDSPQTGGQNNPPQTGEQNNPPQTGEQNNPPQTGEQNNPPQTEIQNTSPQTGDISNMMLWVTLFFISGIYVVTTISLGRKQKMN